MDEENDTSQNAAKVSVQCEENPEGYDGEVVSENVSSPLGRTRNHIFSEDEGVSVDMYAGEFCIIEFNHQNSVGQPAVGHQEDELKKEDREHDPTVPVQCMENQGGLHGQVVYDNLSFGLNLPFPLEAANDDDEGVDVHTSEKEDS